MKIKLIALMIPLGVGILGVACTETRYVPPPPPVTKVETKTVYRPRPKPNPAPKPTPPPDTPENTSFVSPAE